MQKCIREAEYKLVCDSCKKEFDIKREKEFCRVSTPAGGSFFQVECLDICPECQKLPFKVVMENALRTVVLGV